MKILYVLRHAKSDWNNPTVSDHDRPINKKGQHSCVIMAKKFTELEVNPDKIFCSTANRAATTIKTILELQGKNPEDKVEYTKKLYLASPNEVLRFLSANCESENSAMVVFHNPGAEQLTKMLCDYSDPEVLKKLPIQYPTTGLAKIELDCASWQEINPKCGKLVFFEKP